MVLNTVCQMLRLLVHPVNTEEGLDLHVACLIAHLKSESEKQKQRPESTTAISLRDEGIRYCLRADDVYF